MYTRHPYSIYLGQKEDKVTDFPWTGRDGYQITLDSVTRWPGSFDWRVDYWNPHPLCMGWFGSFESAQKWILKQLESGIMKGSNHGK